MKKRERITDLDKFVYEHIKMPYYNHDDMANIDLLCLGNVSLYISAYPKWWSLVADRIDRIGFVFPDYIKHPLVDFLKEQGIVKV